MEPVTTTIIYCFMGYYISSDLANYVSNIRYFKDIINRLDRIEYQLEHQCLPQEPQPGLTL